MPADWIMEAVNISGGLVLSFLNFIGVISLSFKQAADDVGFLYRNARPPAYLACLIRGLISGLRRWCPIAAPSQAMALGRHKRHFLQHRTAAAQALLRAVDEVLVLDRKNISRLNRQIFRCAHTAA